MKNRATSLAFTDLLFNLLLGITFMFIFAFLLIRPSAETGKITPPVKLMVEIRWDDQSRTDVDLWVRGPDKTWVGFRKVDGGYFSLARDDRGTLNDTVEIDGKEVIIKQNYENVSFTMLPEGEYFVNVHHFSGQNENNFEDVEVKMTQLQPFKIIYFGHLTLGIKEEKTALSFTVNRKGEIEDVRPDIQMPFVSIGGVDGLSNSDGTVGDRW